MVKHLYLGPLLLFICLSLATKAQITIGSEELPSPGALLDLKQNNSATDNSSKGLLLPRVELEDKFNLYPMFSPGYDKATEDPEHTGLLVYSVNDCSLGGSGIYIWDGEKWEPLLGEVEIPELYSFTDQNGNSFLARKFGEAGIWMVQNLAATTYDTVRDSDDKGFYNDISIKYPDNKPSLTEDYPWMGVLYNFATATNDSYNIVNEKRVQGICPAGWHVPTSNEWAELENELIRNTDKYTTLTETYLENGVALQGIPPTSGNHTYGSDFKLAALCPCPVPGRMDVDVKGVGLRDIYGGFAIRLIGGILGDGSVDGYGEKGGFWVATRSTQGIAGRNRVYINSNTYINHHGGDMGRYYAIRCKKNGE